MARHIIRRKTPDGRKKFENFKLSRKEAEDFIAKSFSFYHRRDGCY